ncbi:MAG: VIT1/CCC1 transporter family protein [Candidatus Parvarchaeota archaeon]|jgi:predicted membrane protein (TIGR00267 family)|nr:VIT1/CCC1 transporter family protein [Candidatus Parvarchaeota archaeon]MCL5106936.1 VIT1/CCC1 transporter family protein [Candidatus Parvarchaeota archaeon]
MEKAKSRYIILGLSDGLFLGLGISLGISVFHSYQLTFASILLVGVSGSLSNFFSAYNAENFVLGQQMKEYRKILFAKEYNPRKITKLKRAKNLRYAEIGFISTLLGSVIVLLPYLAYYAANAGQSIDTSIISLILSLIILAVIGSYSQENKAQKIKEGLKTAGIGLLIAAISAFLGVLINLFI